MLSERLNRADAGPVELDGRANTVGARAEHNHALVSQRRDIVMLPIVGHVEIVGFRGELSRQRVDPKDRGSDAELFAQRAHLQPAFTDQLPDALIRHAHLFQGPQPLRRKICFDAQSLLDIDDVLDALQKPGVNASNVRDFIDRDSAAHSERKRKQAFGRGRIEVARDILGYRLAVGKDFLGGDTLKVQVQHANGFLVGFLEGAAYAHHLADRLHARAYGLIGPLEFLQVPARNLDHHVVKAGLKAGACHACDAVGQFDQAVAEREFGGNVGQGIACRFARQRGTARKTRIHLDHIEVRRFRIERELHIALPDDIQASHNGGRGGPQRMIFAVVERLAGSDDNRLTGVDAQRVHVFHVTDGDAVVVAVAHYLVFDLFIVMQVVLDQDLGRESQRATDNLSQLPAVMRDARSLAAQRETGAHHDGKTDFLADMQRLCERFRAAALRRRYVDGAQVPREGLPVLGQQDSGDGGSQHTHIVFFQHTALEQFDTAVERGLPAK